MNWIRGNDILSQKRKYKILIYGAGVIGSILAVHFSKNGYYNVLIIRELRKRGTVQWVRQKKYQ